MYFVHRREIEYYENCKKAILNFVYKFNEASAKNRPQD